MIYSIFIFMYPCPLRFGNANRVKEVCISNIKEKQRRINDGNVVNTCDFHIAVTRRVRRTGRKGLIDDFRTGEQDFVCGRIKKRSLDDVGHESWRAVFRVVKSESEESGRARLTC